MVKKLKTYTIDQMIDSMVGKRGTAKREQFEFELTVDTMGSMIRAARKKRNLTQEQLGELIGVRKAQISKLERSASNLTIGTILKIFNALQTNIRFRIEL